MDKMNPVIKDQWTKALRSGEYEQGRAGLAVRGKYCCLGVLCDVAVKMGLDIKVEDHDGEIAFDDEPYWLPQSVAEWAGLPDINPSVPARNPLSDEATTRLSTINDLGVPFSEIADLIEENL